MMYVPQVHGGMERREGACNAESACEYDETPTLGNSTLPQECLTPYDKDFTVNGTVVGCMG